MAVQTLDLAAFRAAFPKYSNATTYPDAQVNAMFATAGFYISLCDAPPPGLQGAQLNWALQLLTAHLLFQADLILQGKTFVIVSASSVDKVSVSLLTPPVDDTFDWWLATTPYGLQLSAMLSVNSVGGFSIGGSPELGAFRKAGGRF